MCYCATQAPCFSFIFLKGKTYYYYYYYYTEECKHTEMELLNNPIKSFARRYLHQSMTSAKGDSHRKNLRRFMLIHKKTETLIISHVMCLDVNGNSP